MRRIYVVSGVLFLLLIVSSSVFYYVNFDEEVGVGEAPYCEITVFEDLDDLESQRYDGSNISVSEFIELNNSENNDLRQDLQIKKGICSETRTNLSEAGNITGEIRLNVSSYDRDYYRNEAGEIIYINADIAT